MAVSAPTAPTVTENPPVPVAAPVRKAAIGSLSDAADKTLQPSQPKAVQIAVANPINLTGEPESEPVVIPDIKSDTGFSDDVDAEIYTSVLMFMVEAAKPVKRQRPMPRHRSLAVIIFNPHALQVPS